MSGVNEPPKTVQELRLDIRVDPAAESVIEDAVCFETGATPEALLNPSVCAYEHHGPGYSETSRGALTSLYEDLIVGRPLPLTLVTRQVKDVDVLVAIALFLRRNLAICPGAAAFVTNVDLVHRFGLVGLAHVEQDVGRFLQFLRGFIQEKGLQGKEIGNRVTQSVGWIQDYLVDGRLPHLGVPPDVTILDHGTNGFAVGETTGPLEEGWVEVFRKGYLRGVLFGPDSTMMAARISRHVALDLQKAQQMLNEAELVCGGSPGWVVDDLTLMSPVGGSTQDRNTLLTILLHC